MNCVFNVLNLMKKVLSTGNLDMDYLGKILEFALVTVEKLSAPAHTEELKAKHRGFLEELAEMCRAGDASRKSHIIALVRGLRYVLDQIQVSIPFFFCILTCFPI